MATKAIDSNSKFNIYSSFTLSNDDVATLSLLYTPLIGSDALTLYLAFASLLERNNLKSEEIKHQDLFDIYSLKPGDFIRARIKLEGIGLLASLIGDNGYVYILYPPLSPKNFIKDVTLGLFLYSKVGKDTFNYIKKHFEIEKIDKSLYNDITKSFDEVFDSNVDNVQTFDKFKYIIGRNPSKNIKIKNNKFNFDDFVKEINIDLLEAGVTKQFKEQITTLAFVYAFNEIEMINLFNDSINKRGIYDYRILKNKANTLFIYKKNMDGPILKTKDEDSQAASDLKDYLEESSPSVILADIIPDFPPKYLDIINEIYSSIELPRGVLNCMIIKVLREKGGELPSAKYFQRVSESWIKDNVFSTLDAIKYVTTMKEEKSKSNSSSSTYTGGFDEL